MKYSFVKAQKINEDTGWIHQQIRNASIPIKNMKIANIQPNSFIEKSYEVSKTNDELAVRLIWKFAIKGLCVDMKAINSFLDSFKEEVKMDLLNIGDVDVLQTLFDFKNGEFLVVAKKIIEIEDAIEDELINIGFYKK